MQRWLQPSGLHVAEMKVEVLILLPWILRAARAKAYSIEIPKNSTCLSNHRRPHGALFSLTSFWSNGILQLSKRRNRVFVVKALDKELEELAYSSTLLQISCLSFMQNYVVLKALFKDRPKSMTALKSWNICASFCSFQQAIKPVVQPEFRQQASSIHEPDKEPQD